MLLKEAHTTHMGYETHATIIIQQSVPSSPDVPDELEKGDTARGLDEIPKGAISPFAVKCEWPSWISGFKLHIWSQGLCENDVGHWLFHIYVRYKILHPQSVVSTLKGLFKMRFRWYNLTHQWRYIET